MSQEHQSRSILTCPKCGSSAMAVQDIREMWTFPHQKKGTIPNFNASFVQRVRCADCNAIVWRDEKLDPEKEDDEYDVALGAWSKKKQEVFEETKDIAKKVQEKSEKPEKGKKA